MRTIIALAVVVNLLTTFIFDKWLVIQVACVVLGCYALWRALLEGIKRLAKLDGEHWQ